jgi:dihydrodipicolinate reductase
MQKVGITGATGRLATILIRQLKDEYQLKLFSFEKPECTPRAKHPAPPTQTPKVATLSSHRHRR